eukprot:TRINITY_DN79331_c0_g1_i1.p1 TRINITY_DN79331_c0_g1~~TRINITY_DN79331_c0_g1_i1.p1  ORF type:complete len:476 (-),score=105.65 TRINITY_DN79331_c0_g1_i1:22-1449(-)
MTGLALLLKQPARSSRRLLGPCSLRRFSSAEERRQGEATERNGSAAASHDVSVKGRWLRRARRRASLAADEFRDLAAERRQLLQARFRKCQQDIHALRGSSASDLLEGLHMQFVEANRRFDDRFNDAFDRRVERLSRLLRQVKRHGPAELWQQSPARVQLLQLLRQLSWLRQYTGNPRHASAKGGQEEKPNSSERQASSYGPPVDTGAMLLMGAGAGTVIQGFAGPGIFLTCWGLGRSARRFVVLCIDTEDPNRLFRFAPASVKERKAEIFVQLHHELHAMRRIRAGDLNYIAKKGDKVWQEGMDASFDHNPESLFDLAMDSIAAHPRVHEWVGKTVNPRADPDKVVYRVHEGIAEVFLGWEVQGELGIAEVQVKATGSIVDFIYIFPQGRDHYGLKPGGFVIRPNGSSWSKDTSELPKDLKQPFGKHNGRVIRNREGIFEYDYEVREFRHGYEGENHPRVQAYKRRWKPWTWSS